MEKRNKLYYFESHNEIRDYMAQGFPSRVYLVARLCTVVKGDQVVHPANRSGNDNNGEEVPQWRINEGYVKEPSQTEIVTVLGTIDDFPADAFATRHDFRRHETEADTVLEGLYEVGDLLAARLRTANSERRTLFTAQELLKPAGKGGVWIEWPEGEQEVLYTVNTATGRYQMCESQVFEMVDRMERVEGVGPAKRHRFAIRNATAQQRDIVARLQFDTDKEVQRIKNCLDKDGISPFAQQPAIEPATGVMIGTNGHILTVHKLSGYEQDAQSGLPAYYCGVMAVPKEVCQMKGRVTIEAVEGKWEESVKKKDGSTELIEEKGIIVTATDAQGRQGVVKQSWRYPNWRSVIPSKIGPAISIDTKKLADGVKRIMPQLCSVSLPMVVEADKGDKILKLSGEDYDFSKESSVAVELAGKMPCPMKVALKASTVVTAAGFAVSTMHFTDASRAMVFIGDTTLTMQMPIEMFDYRKEPHPTDGQLRKFDLNEWVDAPLPEKPQGSKAAVKKPKAKQARAAEIPQHTERAQEPTFAERLREALLKHCRVDEGKRENSKATTTVVYKFSQLHQLNDEFDRVFGIGFKPFYNGLVSVASKHLCIDILKFDDWLHKKHGNYEDSGKSMNDIVCEHYGENGLQLLNKVS